MRYPSSFQFSRAGYEPIATNLTHRGGVVRQYGKISFSRVFDAGHAVGAFQPEIVSKIFDRVMFDKDVATGLVNITAISGGNGSYSSNGPANSFHIKNVLPPSPENECYVWDPVNTCTSEQITALANGTAVVKDFIVENT